MISRPVINPGLLKWSGEHWINYLRVPGADSNSGMVSLFHTRYSAAGEGNVAFIDIPGNPGCEGLYTDNRDVAAFIQDMIRGRGNPFDRELTIVEAHISREGDIRADPSWIIEDERDRIVATWTHILAPLIVEGPSPTFGPDRDFLTILFFAEMATIQINDRDVIGAPYKRDIWRPSIGGERSSCVFALAETMVMVSSSQVT
jgi:hypothetical protein